MGLLLWIILGGIAGWIASMIMGTNARMGLFMNIVVGMLGSVLGAWIMSAIGRAPIMDFSLRSLIVAIFGSIILLGIVRLFNRA